MEKLKWIGMVLLNSYIDRGEILRKSARKEFEIARDERDPLVAMRMIVTSREAIQEARKRMNEKLH